MRTGSSNLSRSFRMNSCDTCWVDVPLPILMGLIFRTSVSGVKIVWWVEESDDVSTKDGTSKRNRRKIWFWNFLTCFLSPPNPGDPSPSMTSHSEKLRGTWKIMTFFFTWETYVGSIKKYVYVEICEKYEEITSLAHLLSHFVSLFSLYLSTIY